MKKLFLFLFVVVLGAMIFFPYALNQIKKQVRSDLYTTGSLTPIARPTLAENQTSEDNASIFVPYWTITNPLRVSDYAEVYYFGVTPSDSGIDTTDEGYKGLSRFVNRTSGMNTYLTLRMLDATQNSAILDDTDRQNKLISQTLSLAKKHGMKGVVLDLEQSSFPFDSLITKISNFSKTFYTAAKKQDLTYYVTMYGDVFYRVRPYDVKTVAENSDRMIIMAYDFHKSRGEPGPNFPLRGADTYGYDFTELTQDFLKIIDAEKVGVAFGYYGYDWEIGSDGKQVENGAPLSTKEIQANFIDKCKYSMCEWVRDSISAETKVTYIDTKGNKHAVWFEDESSVSQKKKYLQKYGISHFTTWAYGYN